MVYQQCGPRCAQTCDNIGSTDCYGGCAEGCFCPDGQVLSRGRCINPIACPGKLHLWNVFLSSELCKMIVTEYDICTHNAIQFNVPISYTCSMQSYGSSVQ